jgi:hypothetical protein
VKWLAAFLCVFACSAYAEQLPKGTIQLPTTLVCGPHSPKLERVYEEYGELPFLNGDGEVLTPDISKAYQGNVRMFLDPKDGSYSVFLDIEDKLTCLIVTGNKIEPTVYGKEL